MAYALHHQGPQAWFAAGLLWLAAGSALAQQPPTALSRQQYQACVAEEDDLQAQRQSLLQRHREHAVAAKRVDSDMAAHIASQGKVDSHDLPAVDAFNKRQDELNARSAQLNGESEKLNREQASFKARIAAANQRCAGMIFSFRERDVVQRENASGGRKK
jgi:uncharacterized protein YhaN